MSIRLSVRQHGTIRRPMGEIFMKHDTSDFRKSVKKIKVSLKYAKNSEYVTWRPVHIYDNISQNSSENEKMLHNTCTENQNTHFMFNIFFFLENQDCYEIMWKNTVHTDRPEMTI